MCHTHCDAAIPGITAFPGREGPGGAISRKPPDHCEAISATPRKGFVWSANRKQREAISPNEAVIAPAGWKGSLDTPDRVVARASSPECHLSKSQFSVAHRHSAAGNGPLASETASGLLSGTSEPRQGAASERRPPPTHPEGGGGAGPPTRRAQPGDRFSLQDTSRRTTQGTSGTSQRSSPVLRNQRRRPPLSKRFSARRPRIDITGRGF